MRLIEDDDHLRWIATTHPDIDLSLDRLALPSFIAPVAVAEALEPGTLTRRLMQGVLRTRRSLVAPDALFLGTPFEPYDQSLLLDVVDPERLVEDARQVARRLGLELCVLPNVSPAHPRLADWLDAGFTSLPSFPDTQMNVEVTDFDAHLARLPAGDRSGIRRNIRRFERAGHRIERLPSTQGLGRLLHRGYRTFFDRAKVHWLAHTEAYFEGLVGDAGLAPDRVHVWAVHAPEAGLVGFIVNFLDGELMHTGRIGVLPEWHPRDRIYFRLLYAAVEDAIASPCTTLSLEPTGYRTKRHLGARKVPLVNLVLGAGATWTQLLRFATPVGRRLLHHLADAHRLDRRF
jgi:hypothetical protein